MHDCIFDYLPDSVLPPGMTAVRCRCHESSYATVFGLGAPHVCPVSGDEAHRPDEPPADEPPADEPPADEPPADEPPADEPPADTPPPDQGTP